MIGVIKSCSEELCDARFPMVFSAMNPEIAHVKTLSRWAGAGVIGTAIPARARTTSAIQRSETAAKVLAALKMGDSSPWVNPPHT